MRFAVQSLLAHGVLVGGMAWFLAHDSGHLEGSTGLAGPARTRFDVTMEAVKTVKTEPKAPAPAPPPVKEGLPVEVKNEKPVEIDTPPPRPAVAAAEPSERSDGNSGDAPAGRTGQDGSGATVAAKIGDSDRTNRFGLYLRKISRKIQSNLGSAGVLQFPTHALLLLDLRRDGTVAKITVAKSSGDPDLDRMAIRAVQKSIPFEPWDSDNRVQLPVEFR